jgi:hypothetical protein
MLCYSRRLLFRRQFTSQGFDCLPIHSSPHHQKYQPTKRRRNARQRNNQLPTPGFALRVPVSQLGHGLTLAVFGG